MIRRISLRAASAVALAGWLGLAPDTRADVVTVNRGTPDIDIWEYPFATSGSRPTMSTFGAVDTPDGFDNRDGEGYVSFRTIPDIGTGKGASNYLIRSASITLTMTVNTVVYDPTYDAVSSYFDATNPNVTPDPDNGRPMELYGVGYRNGVTASTVTNDTPFTPGGSTNPGTRSLYPTDFLGGGLSLNGDSRDVSSNVTAAKPFDPNPFALGSVDAADLDANGKITSLSDVTFNFNLQNPDVIRYLQDSLNIGFLNFLVTSLFATVNGGAGGGFPTYSTMEGTDPPKLNIVVETVPEPSAVTLLICGLGLYVAGYRGARLGGRKGPR